MAHSARRNIGDILLDGGFVQRHDLDAALEDQKLSKELLGQVLVRRGTLKADEIKVPLLIQEHLGSVENAVKLAAGDRQVLGDLLVLAGHITEEQLQQVLAEQRLSGGKFGEVAFSGNTNNSPRNSVAVQGAISMRRGRANRGPSACPCPTRQVAPPREMTSQVPSMRSGDSAESNFPAANQAFSVSAAPASFSK